MPATSPDDIIDLLSRIRERANQHICDELARRGITDLLPAHGAVLHALFEESPQPMSTLARRIGRKKNTATGRTSRNIFFSSASSSAISASSLAQNGMTWTPWAAARSSTSR